MNSLVKLSINGNSNFFQGVIYSYPWYTHPQATLGVYDFLLAEEYNQSYIEKCPGSSKLYNGSEWVLWFWSP